MRERRHKGKDRNGRKRSGPTLHDAMLDEGARLLLDGLRDRDMVPSGCPEDTLRRACRQVQSEWLRGENVIPLFEDLLAEVRRRLPTTDGVKGEEDATG